MERRAKIVATVGPATASPEMLSALIEAGVDVFRLNFSHGTIEGHGEVMETLHHLRATTGRSFALMLDLPGPKVRIGRLVDGGPVLLSAGHEVALHTEQDPGTASRLPVNYPHLAEDVDVGQRILLDDGRIELMVEAVRAGGLQTRVIRGGLLAERKGVNIPGAALRWPAMTERDETVLRFGLDAGADLVALSFVRTAADADPVRKVMRSCGRLTPLIAKIEKPQALQHLGDIVRRFDGVMVARGDLGVELDPEQVPMAQKRIIAAARQAGKPVITATQMLESMTIAPHPTRAEASDVANAVLDGTDAVMLSGETSIGAYPIEAVRTMHRIVCAAESVPAAQRAPRDRSPAASDSEAIAHAAAVLADDLGARALVVTTRSGRTARLVSDERPATPIVAFTDNDAVRFQLALWWGVSVDHLALDGWVDALTPAIESALRARGLVAEGDTFVMVGATPIAAAKRTNLIKLHRAGD